MVEGDRIDHFTRQIPVIPKDIPSNARVKMPVMQSPMRKDGFAEAAMGYSENQVRFEAERCLGCGVCAECLECAHLCDQPGAIVHNETSEELIVNGGVIIIADPLITPDIRGEDVIRAYGPAAAKSDV